ncbi:MAG: hypothetical protein Q8P78_01740 [bacterium]|nr:hypothetical protein [bacterium]
MLSYCAHIPHSPLLLPAISRGKFRQFKKMSQAVVRIRQDVRDRGCETLVLIGPHPSPHEAHFLNVAPRFSISFETYANFSFRAHCPGDIHTAYRIRRGLDGIHPVRAITRESLAGPEAAAAAQLVLPDQALSVLPVSSSRTASLSQLHDFGKKLRDVLEGEAAKIAVVSLGDFSRTSSKNREDGRSLDRLLIQAVQEHNADAVTNCGAKEAETFALAALRPLCILLGLLDGVRHEADILNYEQKYGVGMLAARFV